MVVNNPLIRHYFLGEVALEGHPRIPMIIESMSRCVDFVFVVFLNIEKQNSCTCPLLPGLNRNLDLIPGSFEFEKKCFFRTLSFAKYFLKKYICMWGYAEDINVSTKSNLYE